MYEMGDKFMDMIKDMFYKKDIKCLYFLNATIKCNALDKIFLILTNLGNAANTAAICLLMIGIGNTFVRQVGIQALIVLIVTHLIVQGLKRTVTRVRPKDVLTDINTFKLPLDRYSFPSGHTTAVFAIATTVSLYIPAIAILILPVALLVGLSRIYLGVHYPSDVIIGIVIAVVTSLLFFYR